VPAARCCGTVGVPTRSASVAPGKKAAVPPLFILKLMMLPRQARDKHSEALKKGCSLAVRGRSSVPSASTVPTRRRLRAALTGEETLSTLVCEGRLHQTGSSILRTELR
jgi:hypothetical protein